ncbi:MAG: O-succinylbenzoic acid--CoA ligase, partial [Salibacteraceae bacterium]
VVLNNAHSFEWVGRLDNVINTGGIKVNPEKVERFLDSQIESNFFVSGIQHPELGNEVVLFIEGEKANLKLNYTELSQYEIPKRMVFIDSFSYTKTNKINRTETLRLLNVL